VFASIFDPLADLFGWPFMQFYALTNSYVVSIMLVTVVVMIITTPLTLKSTKGMLEMQRLQPELKRLQAQHRGDRQKLNEEMMKLYQQHKVNPLASCFPLLLQMPVFIGMFQLLRGLTSSTDPQTGNFLPKHISKSSDLYLDLSKADQMVSWGLNLAKSPREMFEDSAGRGVLYVVFVVVLAFLYWVQQKMVANRTVSPTMSAAQQKLMQYLPVGFAVFQIFFPLGLIIYYLFQTVLRIAQQQYVTRRFYHGEGSLGQQAQAAGAEAREIAKAEKGPKGEKAKPAKTEDRPKGGQPAKTENARPVPKNRPKPTRDGKPVDASRPATPSKPSKPSRSTAPSKPSKPSGSTKSPKPNKPQK